MIVNSFDGGNGNTTDYKMAFGLYRGHNVAQLPRGYLKWLVAKVELYPPDFEAEVKRQLALKETTVTNN